MKKNNHFPNIMLGLAYLYMVLPFLIFAIGWMGKRFWIPIVTIVIICLIKTFKNSYNTISLQIIDYKKFLFILCIIGVWVYLSGIGKYVFQNEDHYTRNGIFEILVNYEWPIINDVVTGTLPGNPHATSLMYYIGYWLPSAIVGKVVGINAGYFFQYIWAVLGIVLVYYFLCVKLDKFLVWPILIIIFFSGLDLVGIWLTGENLFSISNDMHLEWWGQPYQYSSMTTQLFWVFNQSIPAWLCTILIMTQKNNKSIVFLLSCALITSTFPFVGLIFISVFYCFNNIKKLDFISHIKSTLKSTLTIQNVLGGGIIGIFTFLYLKSNVASGQFMKESVYGYSYDNNLLKYLIFILLEIGVYFVLLYKYNNKNFLYYLLLLLLCLIPPIKIGEGADFCMRVSIPPLFILMVLIIEAIDKSYRLRDRVIFYTFVITLLIGSVTPLHEMSRTISNTINSVNEGEDPALPSRDAVEILNTDYLSGNIDDSFFFKYIAR